MFECVNKDATVIMKENIISLFTFAEKYATANAHDNNKNNK